MEESIRDGGHAREIAGPDLLTHDHGVPAVVVESAVAVQVDDLEADTFHASGEDLAVGTLPGIPGAADSEHVPSATIGLQLYAGARGGDVSLRLAVGVGVQVQGGGVLQSDGELHAIEHKGGDKGTPMVAGQQVVPGLWRCAVQGLCLCTGSLLPVTLLRILGDEQGDQEKCGGEAHGQRCTGHPAA